LIYQYICQPAHVVDAVPVVRIPQSKANYALGSVEKHLVDINDECQLRN
jgi:hypothetical protein